MFFDLDHNTQKDASKKKQCNVWMQFQWVCSQVEKKACEFFTVIDHINAMLESGFSLC